MALGIDEIKKIIPHRAPFLLIDEFAVRVWGCDMDFENPERTAIVELEPGVRAVGKKNVSMKDEYLKGHFPGNPVMPGVLMLEAMAQVGAVIILSVEENKGKTAFFGGMDKVKFRRKVIPGDVLCMECEVIKQKGPIGIAKATAKVGDELAVSAEMTVVLG